MSKLYTYIVSCLSSVLDVVIVITTNTADCVVQVVQVVLNGLRVV